MTEQNAKITITAEDDSAIKESNKLKKNLKETGSTAKKTGSDIDHAGKKKRSNYKFTLQ